ncbi:hypothetical protein E4U13_001847 [Claviceps humidiphila]|uniref:Myb-like domain-containing protein n=1 Tax=Claviceps humidiphila TaxID=1294629 RepID=A0A9P7Q244_9HYPO|nr:hypothetical protein E4U13_001847 [Claviceps humidiphila]
MSSMFKKKGGLAFKPKAPIARARPQASTAKPTPAPTATPIAQSTFEVEKGSEIEIEPETVDDGLDTRPARRRDSSVPVEEEAGEKQKDSPLASRPSTRRASHSQQVDPALEDSISLQGGQAAAQSNEIIEPDSVAVDTAQVAPLSELASGVPARRQSTAEPLEPLPQPSLIDKAATAATTNGDVIPSSSEISADPRPTESLDESQNVLISALTQEEEAGAAEESAAAVSSHVQTPAPKPAPKPAPTRTRARNQTTAASAAAENASTEEGEATQGESSRPKKRQKRTATRKQDGESGTTPAPRKRKTPAPNANGSRSNSRRARSPTPDDAETQVVDLQKLKMADLTKDLRIGKKFSRHDELRERERKARMKAKLEKDLEIPGEAGGDSNNTNDKTSQSPAPGGTQSAAKPNSAASTSTPAPAATSGPQFRIVDGQIVVDQDSLVMDRHARAAAAQAGEDMETIEENDFTRLITSSSFMTTSKLKGPNLWTEPETELFYRGLRMFGTEFEMISKMFPGKQRRHIKLKFNREERHNPARIDAAVMGEKTIKMDLDEYQAFTGASFEPVEDIEAEQRKIQEGYEAERQRVVDEQAEIMRKKREELFADDDEDSGRRKKGKGKKKGRQAISYGLNGEPIVPQDA